jgi:hypothetical protein
MITSDKGNQIRIAHFVSKKEKKGFNAIKASVHEISQKKIANSRDIPTILK